MRDVVIVGGGLAGMAAAAALGETGATVTVLEGKPFVGGRATSYALPGIGLEEIDNCQHVLLRCCVNLLNFYERLGVRERVRFYSEIPFLEPGGRMSIFAKGLLPAPLHFTESFLRMQYIGWADKVRVARAFLAILWERGRRKDLEEISMLDWLHEKQQGPVAIERFWRQVLVSAINEELDRMAASHGFQVIWLGFMAARDSYEMGVPEVRLGELYAAEQWKRMPNVQFRTRAGVQRLLSDGRRVTGAQVGDEQVTAESYISAVPFEKFSALCPEAEVAVSAFSHSSITGIHLWFDRAVTDLPHATLLDRNLQWFFNKGEGKYLQLVVSASKPLLPMTKAEVITLALRELAEFLPKVNEAKLVQAHVVKEARATYSAGPGLWRHRPEPVTKLENLFLAGDWTRSGWPSTMEGAVRSGYRAAEAVTQHWGAPRRFLLPDIA